MLGKTPRRLAPWAAIAALLLAAAPASADVSRPPSLQNFDFKIPAGQGCSFAIDIKGTNGQITEVTLKNGSIFNVGKGVLLTYTNLSNGKTYTVNTSGSVNRFIQNANGTVTLEATGHNGFIFFPTDATGPRVTQYTGRIVVTLDSLVTQNALSVNATSGQAVDVCAAIS
ncbi:hypothetical protein OOZ51_13605 [Arthrobacter sp. MI7-26]|uniref:hypothetical protein n=1 Tax=Arthrobacter sp. MI7-26 TaxID=2993653 RepID=UPI002249057B|nr:hypothetical protein [Arthrobacter sp. MI7-26]MCX2748840.1 hypothetical protein [Arthrobacter sp. MI7-26]